MKENGFSEPYTGGEAEPHQPLVGDALKVLPHGLGVHPRQAVAAQIAGELQLRLDGLPQHVGHLLPQLLVEEPGLLLADGVDHVEGEGHVHRLVPEHPVGAGGQTVQQPPARNQ